MKPLSKKARGISPSETILLDSRAKELIAQGRDIINLCAGELDKAPPEAAARAAVRCIEAGKIKYDSSTGLFELRAAIGDSIRGALGLDYLPDQIVVSSGGKQALFNALCTLIDPGDQVLIPAPYWVTFPQAVKLAGGEPIMVPTEPGSGYKVGPEDLEKKRTSKTKLLILNSPCNPTGAVYTRSELDAISKWVTSSDLYCLSDEIYEKIVYGESVHQSIAQGTALDRTVIVSGMSKTYAMTGWRLGYSASNIEIADAIGRIQTQTTHHPSVVAQHAGLAALLHGGGFIQETVSELTINKQQVEEVLSPVKGISFVPPMGAFYFFVDYTPLFVSKGQEPWKSRHLCQSLLENFGVAVVPGSAFGMEYHLRLSFGGDRTDLGRGLDRIKKGLEGLG